MELFALTPTQLAGGQIALAVFLGFVGIWILLPRPRGRLIWGGIASLIAATTVLVCYLQITFGNPMPDLIGTVLFWLFSLGALVFGTALVVQRNPARGAIAFAFVILSTCGLFLLLAAPFLMAATIIIYAGAIIVTFLFVLMLSQPKGESNENDRSREPQLGALAGFAFVGLVLFSLYLTYSGGNDEDASETSKKIHRLPALVLTNKERKELADIIAKLDAANEHLANDKDPAEYFEKIKDSIARIAGDSPSEEATGNIKDGSIRQRLEKEPGRVGAGAVLYREDQQTRAVLERAKSIRQLNPIVFKNLENYLSDKRSGHTESIKGDKKTISQEDIKSEIQHLREELLLLHGAAELPARNVENLGFLLYTDHLLAIELAGTLLLVATIGAVAIAQRKGMPT
jgi:NADH-quinone oxidoreductase subunit J